MSSSATEEYSDSGAEGYEGATSPDTTQDDYVSRPGQKDAIPVQSDNADVEDPVDANTADSDEQLERDDADAVDESNIIEERTRGAGPEGGYQEPGDEEGLGGNDGRSRVAGGPN